MLKKYNVLVVELHFAQPYFNNKNNKKYNIL